MSEFELEDLLFYRAYLMRLKNRFLNLGIYKYNKDFIYFIDFFNSLIKRALLDDLVLLNGDEEERFIQFLNFEREILGGIN